MSFDVWASLLIRSALILLTAEVLGRFSPRWRAAERHRIVLAGYALLALWPLLSALLPAFAVPLWPQTALRASVTIEQTFTLIAARPARSIVHWPVLIWLAGVALSAAPVLLSYVSCTKLRRRAALLQDPAWANLLQQLRLELGMNRRPSLFTLRGPVMPLTFGLFRPGILLPDDCLEWSDQRKRLVLLHELGHIQRHDLAAQLFASLITAMWWFQPLCWTSLRALRRESEQACDSIALSSGVRPTEYATELLQIARSFGKRDHWASAAITMARHGELETRLHAILSLPAQGSARRTFFAALTTLILITASASAVTVSTTERNTSTGGPYMKRTLLSGLLTSAGLSAATISGSLFDATGLAVPNAKAVLVNPDTSARQEAATANDGKFTFDHLPAGQYILRVEKPGFASLFREFNVQQEVTIERGLTLQAGSATPPASTLPEDQLPVKSPPASLTRLRVGGEAEQSNLIKKIQPVYPVSAKAAGLQGVVHMEVVISADGIPLEIQVTSSPGDDLTESALEAVRQWRYRPTLLNGEPIEVLTEVIVNYTLSK